MKRVDQSCQHKLKNDLIHIFSFCEMDKSGPSLVLSLSCNTINMHIIETGETMTKKEHLQYVLERFNQNTEALKVLAHDAHSIGEAKDVILNIELIKHQMESIVDKYEYLTSDWNNKSFKCSEDDDNW